MSLQSVINELSEKVPQAENTYIGEDGLKYCAKHNWPVQVKITLFGTEKIQNCVCKYCREEEEEKKRKDKVEQIRKEVFAGRDMKGWTFEKDDRENEKISDALIKYCDNFAEFKAAAKGVLLYGPVGTGKTFLAACVANRLIEKGYSVHIEKLTDIVERMQEGYGKTKTVLDELTKYDLLIIDDLGTERDTAFMNEKIFSVIDARYNVGLPFIITTNLTGEQMQTPKSLEFERVIDRIFERCIFIKFEGDSRRRKTLIKEQGRYKKMLGLD